MVFKKAGLAGLSHYLPFFNAFSLQSKDRDVCFAAFKFEGNGWMDEWLRKNCTCWKL